MGKVVARPITIAACLIYALTQFGCVRNSATLTGDIEVPSIFHEPSFDGEIRVAKLNDMQKTTVREALTRIFYERRGIEVDGESWMEFFEEMHTLIKDIAVTVPCKNGRFSAQISNGTFVIYVYGKGYGWVHIVTVQSDTHVILNNLNVLKMSTR